MFKSWHLGKCDFFFLIDFFDAGSQELENKANGSLDYSQLNRELSATGTMFSPGTGVGNAVVVSDESPQGSPGSAPAPKQAELDISVDKDEVK